jgi:hypothetical protein
MAAVLFVELPSANTESRRGKPRRLFLLLPGRQIWLAAQTAHACNGALTTEVRIDLPDASQITLACQENGDSTREKAPIRIFALISS